MTPSSSSRWQRRCALLCALLVSLAASPGHGQQPAPQPDAREVTAREMFAVGRYADALQIYGKLYAETAHPTYLRNVGRCYQNLGEPDKAISSFREYLRQTRDLPPDQRSIVQGYIAEMEELKRKRGTVNPPPASPVPVSPAPVRPAPPGAGPVVSAAPLSPPAVVAVAPAAPDGGPPRGERAGRRTAAYVIGGASVAAIAAGAFFGLRAISKHDDSNPHCPMDVCDDTGYELNEQAKTAARISDVTIGAGLIGAGVAAYLYLTSRAVAPATTAPLTSIRPQARRDGAALVVDVSW